MKRMWLEIMTCLAAALLLAACGKKAEPKSLVLGTDAKFPPFETLGGASGNDVIGFDVEIAKAVAAQAGRTLRIERMDFDQLLPALAAGKVDLVLAAMSITDARRQQADFSVPYYKATQVVLILAGGPVPESKDELKGLRIAAQAGSTGAAAAAELTSTENIRLVGAPKDAVVLLLNSQVDAVIIDEQPALHLVEMDPLLMLIRPAFDEEFYGAAVAKGNTNLLETVNQTLAAMSADGRYDQLVNDWLVQAPEPRE